MCDRHPSRPAHPQRSVAALPSGEIPNGVNLGDVMVHGQDLLGDGVNVAARLQTAAQPGGICISGSVHDQISNKLSLSFQSLGEMNFKNIQQPVRTFSIAEAGSRGAVPLPSVVTPRIGKMDRGRATVLVLLAGGAYWAYTVVEGNRRETARAIAEEVRPKSPAPEAANPSVEKLPTEQPVPTASTVRPASEPKPGAAETPRQNHLARTGATEGECCCAVCC